MNRRARLAGALLLCSVLQAGCSTMAYYGQAIQGHLEISGRTTDIEQLLLQPDLDPELAARLRRLQALLNFASDRLHLPDNGSYRRYADLQRDYVTWTLVATEEFSLEPRQWCFPLFGCLSYRGYFRKADAERAAADLRHAGMDVSLSGSTAYSSLGLFKDPLLNTMLAQDEAGLAETLFHELAHQRLYFKDDTAFNEAYATVVAIAGTESWLKQEKRLDALRQYREGNRRRQQFRALVGATREHLRQLYATPLDPNEKRTQKSLAFQQLKTRYRNIRKNWHDGISYDRWMEQPLNNAHLALVSTYQELMPPFRQLLNRCENDLDRFHRTVESLEALSPGERRRKLPGLACSPVRSL